MKKFVRELKEKDHIQTVFLVSEKNTGVDRNSKPFLSVTLVDSSGQINARLFERAQEVGDGFEVGDVVWVKGFVQLFQNRRQMILHDIRKAQNDEYNMPDLVADLAGDPRANLNELLSVVQSLNNDMVREILIRTLNDSEVQARVLQSPAAKTIHHAYRGGLIEHVCAIVKVMDSLVGHYSFLDRDLLIFGAIYHDLGKVFELSVSDGIQYTTAGRLVGHMAIACELIDRFSAGIPDFSPELKDVLKHIVLSHHGKLEYGSPKLPMLPEALVVAMIDDLDSKLNTLFHFLRTEVENVPDSESWSHYHPGFERYFYLDFFRRMIGSK